MWLTSNPHINIDHEELAMLSSKAAKIKFTLGNIMSGFHRKSVWPLNIDALVHDISPRQCFIIADDGKDRSDTKPIISGSNATTFVVDANNVDDNVGDANIVDFNIADANNFDANLVCFMARVGQ